MNLDLDLTAPASRLWRRAGLATLAVLLLGLIPLRGVDMADAAKAAPKDFFGIFAESDAEDDFKGSAKAGFGAFRVPVNWASVQLSRGGPYNWTAPDRGVYLAAKYGMRPVLVIFGSPSFVGSSKKGFVPPRKKADLKEWESFIAAAAARYGRDGSFYLAHPELAKLHVKTWVAWNEQNAVPYWAPKPNPRQYGKLLKAFSRGVRSADPKAKVVTGGMYGFPRAKQSKTSVQFLRKLYEVKGIKKHFDAVGLHPYDPTLKQVKGQITSIRKVMKQAGDGRTGILVGELGWASSGPRGNRLVVGKQKQARMLSKALKLMLRKRKPWRITGAFVYTWRDFSYPTSCPWCPGAGLVKENGKAKPALKAVKKVIRSAR